MRYHHTAALGALGLLLAGCNTMTVRETVLSTNQRVAMVSNPGDGVTPPTNLVLLEGKPGHFVPVAAGFGQAPATAILTGSAGGIAIGAGAYGAARVVRAPVTNVVQGGASAQANGGNLTSTIVGGNSLATATGGTATGGSVNVTVP